MASGSKPCDEDVSEVLGALNAEAFLKALSPRLRTLVGLIDQDLLDVFDTSFKATSSYFLTEAQGTRKPSGLDGFQGQGALQAAQQGLLSFLIGVFSNIAYSRVVDPILPTAAQIEHSVTGMDYMRRLIDTSRLTRDDVVKLKRALDEDAVMRDILNRTSIKVITR